MGLLPPFLPPCLPLPSRDPRVLEREKTRWRSSSKARNAIFPLAVPPASEAESGRPHSEPVLRSPLISIAIPLGIRYDALLQDYFSFVVHRWSWPTPRMEEMSTRHLPWASWGAKRKTGRLLSSPHADPSTPCGAWCRLVGMRSWSLLREDIFRQKSFRTPPPPFPPRPPPHPPRSASTFDPTPPPCETTPYLLLEGRQKARRGSLRPPPPALSHGHYTPASEAGPPPRESTESDSVGHPGGGRRVAWPPLDCRPC